MPVRAYISGACFLTQASNVGVCAGQGFCAYHYTSIYPKTGAPLIYGVHMDYFTGPCAFACADGADIPIEERDGDEFRLVHEALAEHQMLAATSASAGPGDVTNS